MMKIKSLFLTIMLTLCALSPMSSIIAAQPAAPARQGVAMGVAGDLWKFSKFVCRSAYNVVATGNDLWNEHMTKEAFYCIAGVSSAWAIYNYYSTILGIYKKYKNSNKLCVWRLDLWNNHVRMRMTEPAVLAQLDSERTDRTIQNEAARAQALLDLINPELDELKRDMKSLEDQFLTFFKFIEYIPGCKPLGIERNYKHIKPQNLEEINWSEQQFNTIDMAMKAASNLSWWHPLCLTVNYGNAAYVWWELKKFSLRLELLVHWLNPIATGKSRFPNISMANVGISQTKATFQPAVLPL